MTVVLMKEEEVEAVEEQNVIVVMADVEWEMSFEVPGVEG